MNYRSKFRGYSTSSVQLTLKKNPLCLSIATIDTFQLKCLLNLCSCLFFVVCGNMAGRLKTVGFSDLFTKTKKKCILSSRISTPPPPIYCRDILTRSVHRLHSI